MQAKTKVRVTLSLELLTLIYNSRDSELLKDHQEEVTKTIGLIMVKQDHGILKPAYTTSPVVPTIESKIKQGIATEEEVAEYNKKLMEGLV